jgi:hypothetical protein
MSAGFTVQGQSSTVAGAQSHQRQPEGPGSWLLALSTAESAGCRGGAELNRALPIQGFKIQDQGF